ncbi:MAG: AAA family ATPase [Lysobacter sp.]|nr:AAA family ATPase [Lysobacter sp.]
MRITKLEISKFRSIEHLIFDADSLTVLCGANSSGKSNVLRAVRFAFVPEFDRDRMVRNFPLFVTSGNATVKVKLTFDKPTALIAAAFSIPPDGAWSYEVNVKRSGAATFYVNGTKITPLQRESILSNVWIVFVPAIRDISGDGLMPFKRMLSDAIRQARGSGSISSASSSLRTAVTAKGKHLLAGSQFPAIGKLEVDVADVDFESMLSEAVINVRTASGTLPLEGFGTGHQSQVVLGLYRQFGQGLNKFVLFQFEEPDNHMHTTAMRAIADDLLSVASQQDSQVFITTHSPALMNQFELRTAVSLINRDGRTQRRSSADKIDDREFRVGLSQFGMRPAEALTARLVVVVEGPTDVTLVRSLYRHFHGRDPERDDVLIIAAGGKDSAVRLCKMLNDLGVAWRCVLDYDAALNESRPYFIDGLNAADKVSLATSINAVKMKIFSPGLKQPRAKKIMDAMSAELSGSRPDASFSGSLIAKLVDHMKLLSAVDRAVLAKSAVEGKHRKWRDHLWKCGIWLWSADPEDLLVQKDAVLTAVEAFLRSKGSLTASFTDTEKLRAAVANKLHSLASEPDLLQGALEVIFSAGTLGTDQFRVLASRLRV